ncbi:MAG: glycosyltransferase family 2 protein [Oscillospiraceae bacterium]|nr:glycosyltransferase family 2 protein [Oscillospiraceae bacterium]
MISVIIPAFNEEKMIAKTAKTLSSLLRSAGIPYELLFIDDGSTDKTWEAIQEAAKTDRGVRGVHFSRNFGKESAMFAGLEKATGDCCVVMDCDLQHPPEKIIEMFHLWEQGYEVVEGVKEDRGMETGAHRFAANSFYALISSAIGMDMSSSSDFKLLDRKVVDTLNKMPERNVFFRALSYWVGFRKAEVKYSVQERTAGESKWSTRSLIRYAIKNITSFSSAPLHCITLMGGLMLLIAVIFTVISLVQKINGTAAEGFTTVIILLLITGSLIMLSLGVIGYYISKMYEELKGRPRYIISEECGGTHD